MKKKGVKNILEVLQGVLFIALLVFCSACDSENLTIPFVGGAFCAAGLFLIEKVKSLFV
jgi:hypothetical protein